jgi:transcriptional regulator with XRE-family HTH domain
MLYTEIGKIITRLRSEHAGSGISQDALGKEIGTTANTISRWEKAVYKPSANDLNKLSRFFGVSISVFFPANQLNDKQNALLSATGDLNDVAMDELIEYAKFRKAREALKIANK